MTLTIVVVLVILAIAAVVMRSVGTRRARDAGAAARRERIAQTGEDPADNPVNNAVNRWGSRHPVAAKVAPVALVVVLGIVFLVWDS
ncbi:MAG: hypothetical protein ACTHKG_20810 [Nocardioides sp.]